MNGPVKRNPNAAVSLGAGSGGGALVTWGLTKVGVHVDPVQAALLAGGVASVALFAGRNGLRGVVRAIWRGTRSTS